MAFTKSQTVTSVIARLLIAWVFIPSGIFKLIDNPAATAYIANVGGLPFAGILSWLVGILEITAGIAIILGFKTRFFALGLALFCVATALLFHAGVGPQDGFSEAANAELATLHIIMILKNLSMAGGLLLLYVWGAGPASLDNKLAK